MNSDLRRSKRFKDFIPVKLVAQNGLNGRKEAGPFSGRIIDISRHGACLLMPLGILDSYKIYSTTINNDSSSIEIQVDMLPDMNNFRLSARPAWTDPFILDDIRAFKMGVEFLINPEGEQMNSIMECVTAS